VIDMWPLGGRFCPGKILSVGYVRGGFSPGGIVRFPLSAGEAQSDERCVNKRQSLGSHHQLRARETIMADTGSH